MTYKFTFKEAVPILSFLCELKANKNLLNETELEASTKRALTEFLAIYEPREKSVKTGEEISSINIEQETVELYNSLKNLELTYGDSVIDPKEQMQMIKLKASLQDQILNMVKSAKEITSIREFENAVFEVLKDQPDKVEQLEQILGKKGE